MTTRLAELVPAIVLTPGNDAGHLKAFACGPRNNRLTCREPTRARSENVHPAIRAGENAGR
jgi:hypothetical protein